MSSSATTAAIGASGTTPVATATVRPVNRWPAPRGSNGAGRTCCPPSTSTSSSPCPRRSPRSPPRTRPSSTVSSSGPSPTRSARSPPTLATSAPRSALRRPPHLGPDARPSSASALRHPGRGAGERRPRLGCLPPRVLPAGPGSLTLLPPCPPPGAAGRLRVRTAALRGPAAAPRRPPALRRAPPPGPRDRVGGLREAILRRPRTGPRLPRPLHPPDRHRRPAPVQPPGRTGPAVVGVAEAHGAAVVRRP